MGPKSIIVQRTLYDIRDDNSYTIRKLADGNCWMTENLRLGDPTKEITLTPADSNVAENFVLPVGEDWTTNGHKWGDGNNSSTDTQLVDEKHVYVRDKDVYGALYNYYTAVAGTRTYAQTTTAEYDICPKGFEMPDSSAYRNIFSVYDIPTGYSSSFVFPEAVLEFPLSFSFGGHYWCGGSIPRTVSSDYTLGGYFTKTSNTSSTNWYKASGVFIAKNYNTKNVSVTNWGIAKQDGYSIRCVAK